MHKSNIKKLREIDRTIVAVIVVSSDSKILLGKKDPTKGGVYPNAWHTPGGGVNNGERLEAAAIRECAEETGIDLENIKLKYIPITGNGGAEKLLITGELVWCNMVFHRFEALIDMPSAKINIMPGDDLYQLSWFEPRQLESIVLIPGALKFFRDAGYI